MRTCTHFALTSGIKGIAMHKSLRILCLILALVILAALTSKAAGVDPGIKDTISIDSVPTYVSGTSIIPVRLYNDEPLTSIEVTVRLNKADVKIDSFSFEGGRVASVPFKDYQVSDDSAIIAFAIDVGSQSPLLAGSGLMGNLYLSHANSISPEVVTIDSTTWDIPGVFIEHTTILIDTLGAAFAPQFRKGYLDIRQDPTRPDSVWVTDVQANVGSYAVVDVGLYNAVNIQEVSLAFNWNSDRLTFDSISYAGLRGETAPSRSINKSNGAKQLLAMFTFNSGSPLTPGSGIAARLYFTVNPNAPETTVIIDSTSFLGSQSTYLLLTADDGGSSFAPNFHRGSIALKLGTDVNDGSGNLPKAFALSQNYPNPFNPTTEIQFSLPKASNVRLDIYNILGAQVRTLTDRQYAAGTHTLSFDGRNESGQQLATGLYFYRITADSFVQTKKMMLLK